MGLVLVLDFWFGFGFVIIRNFFKKIKMKNISSLSFTKARQNELSQIGKRSFLLFLPSLKKEKKLLTVKLRTLY